MKTGSRGQGPGKNRYKDRAYSILEEFRRRGAVFG